MPFTPETKNPGDLVKSKDWNDAMTAIVELFVKFQAGGHRHTGVGEDAPQIQQNGIADNAITANKIQDNAVTNTKLQNNAVNAAKIQDNSIPGTKIQNGAITAEKIAPGVVPRDIGIAVTPGLQNGQSIPPPSGFATNECVFFAFAKSFTVPAGGGTFTVFTDAAGVVSASFPAGGALAVVGVAIAKRGGWT